MSGIAFSSRGEATLKINHTEYDPIEITHFGGVPIFRTQLALQLRKLVSPPEFDGGQAVQGCGLRNFGAPA